MRELISYGAYSAYMQLPVSITLNIGDVYSYKIGISVT